MGRPRPPIDTLVMAPGQSLLRTADNFELRSHHFLEPREALFLQSALSPWAYERVVIALQDGATCRRVRRFPPRELTKVFIYSLVRGPWMPGPRSDTVERIHERIAQATPSGVWSRADFLDIGALQTPSKKRFNGSPAAVKFAVPIASL